MKFIIYGLIDPRTRLIRYVGKSMSGLQRPRQHRKCGPSTGPHCKAWVSSLQREGLDYEIVILDTVDDPAKLSNLERYWIAFGRASGWPLTNLTDGGDGVPNPSAETRARMGVKNRGRKPSPEVRARMSASAMGHVVTEDMRAKMRAAKLGDLNPTKRPEVAKKISEGHRRAYADQQAYSERECYSLNDEDWF